MLTHPLENFMIDGQDNNDFGVAAQPCLKILTYPGGLLAHQFTAAFGRNRSAVFTRSQRADANDTTVRLCFHNDNALNACTMDKAGGF